MDAIAVSLVMFIAVLVSGMIVRVLPVAVPLPLVQIALGALISGVFHHGVRLDPEIFFFLFLPPLLFLDGWRIPKEGLLRDKFSIIELAFGLVIFTVIGLGLLIHWMIPAMPLPVAFALAAIVSPTDPVAVSAITQRVAIPGRIMHILEGESLLNDASGLVAFRFAVAAAVTGTFSLATAATSFLWVALAGLAIGGGFAWLITTAKAVFSRRYGEEPGSEILLSLLIPFGAYGLAEHAGASGILAAVAAGIVMSYAELSGRALATTRMQRTAVWNMVQFTLNGIMFVLLGEQLPAIFEGAAHAAAQTGHHSLWWLVAYAVGINVALALLRFGWVWISLQAGRIAARWQGREAPPPSLRLTLAMSLAGVRGAITLAGVLTLPLTLADGSPFPARDLAIFLAAMVIILSLIAASIGLPRLLRNLEAPPETERQHQEELAETAAREAACRGIQDALGKLTQAHPDEDPAVFTEVAARVTSSFNQAVYGGMGQEADAIAIQRQAEIERQLRLAALAASRDEIFRLARNGRISDELAREQVRRIDLQEARLH